jgi:GcrA cell cycle regulator
MTDNNSLSPIVLPPDGTGVASDKDTTATERPGRALEKPVRRMAGQKVVTTATLTHWTCRWPIGDPTAADFHYCGKSPQSGSPYCESHDRLSYQTVSRRK